MEGNASNSGPKALRILGLILLLSGTAGLGYVAARWQRAPAATPPPSAVVRDVIASAERDAQRASARLAQMNEKKFALLKAAEERGRSGRLSARLAQLRQLRRRTAKLVQPGAPELVDLDRQIRETKLALQNLPHEARFLAKLSEQVRVYGGEVDRRRRKAEELRAVFEKGNTPVRSQPPPIQAWGAGLLCLIFGGFCFHRGAPAGSQERRQGPAPTSGAGDQIYGDLVTAVRHLYTPAAAPPAAIIARLKSISEALMELCAASPDDFQKLLGKPCVDLPAHSAQVALSTILWTAVLPLDTGTRIRIALAAFLHDLVAVNLPQRPSPGVAMSIAHHSSKLVDRFPEFSAEESAWIAQVLGRMHQPAAEKDPAPAAIYSALLSFCDQAAWQSHASHLLGSSAEAAWKTAFKAMLTMQKGAARLGPGSPATSDGSSERLRLIGRI